MGVPRVGSRDRGGGLPYTQASTASSPTSSYPPSAQLDSCPLRESDSFPTMQTWPKLIAALAWRGIRNPATGLALLRVGWRFRSRDWYRRFPFIPLPAQEYMRWRMYTAYGNAQIVPPADDIVRYARWAVKDS